MARKAMPKVVKAKLTVGEQMLKAELIYARKRAFAALLKYGSHLEECPAYPRIDEECTCGYTDTLRAFDVEKEK